MRTTVLGRAQKGNRATGALAKEHEDLIATCDEKERKPVSADVAFSLQTTRAFHAFSELKLLMKLFSCGYRKEKKKRGWKGI